MTNEEIKSWLSWAEGPGEIHPTVVAFIKAWPTTLHMDSKYGPSCAMWMNVSRAIKGEEPLAMTKDTTNAELGDQDEEPAVKSST